MTEPRPSSTGPTKVLFVCLGETPTVAPAVKQHALRHWALAGNICRSPTAEAVFKTVVERAGLSDQFVIDSCGTGGGQPDWYKSGGWSYHEGDESDERMTETAKTRGRCCCPFSSPGRTAGRADPQVWSLCRHLPDLALPPAAAAGHQRL